ncbi:aldo/keto reductase [Cryptosporangium arvum]|uniref:Putative oxidoreductase, aryl-alcohol dehydrogenase like protein n=1 Tax=Cryptosporangium arvum DSM 44712 TaxID=927661 RepID=A0A011ALL9_9ACTN|nr:aldo/keto reductase [Cryptosporangium arvum]EXG82816.1 putative oxidoreductase, aryl-alcohol dehydrogenase like protein [Cryptosporangium arvum DSM 44712]
MRYIKLGTTGLDVSSIAIGAMTYGEPDRGHPVWSKGEEDARPLIRHALEAGINFFDTANMYSNGSSEEILGRALRDFADRDEVVIATKLRHPMRLGPNGRGLSRKAVLTEVDHSLRRLGTDYIDLYQIHRNDRSTPWEETLEALSDLVTAGKVRYLGALSMHAWEFAKALHLQKRHGWARFVSMQDHYNLLAREEEREMIPLCLDEGVGTVVWSPLARGRLARAWDDARATARSATDGSYADLLYPPLEEASDRAIVDAVGRVAGARGIHRAQVALAWLRHQPVVTAPLVGAGSIAQIDDAVASLDVELTDDEVRALEAPYTPRHDWQGISDEAELEAVRRRVPGMALSARG